MTFTWTATPVALFQFHIGLIKSNHPGLFSISIPGFNSTLVWLKGFKPSSKNVKKLCFNSTLVWLKVAFPIHLSLSILCFNSTLVWLKDLKKFMRATLILCFNSTLVWLKARGENLKMSWRAVSIPHWSD